ncbi:site-specific integrase [Burkholderia ubonensis]|uniref:site-specific integrase n=1 Tax=Burkholderia ubonensis TaxID=101571 RepID=UPI0005D7760C|nr:site-specific integrase [Burkholderia ubonensis]AJX16502.1 phage integrase family protein [Burkholderia ubonensis MSMB22]OJB70590.1 integrase [Burkholderia ubonensis]
MASIENRSHYEVSVKHRDDLTQTFAHNAKKKAEEYCRSLTAQGFKPKLGRLDNYYIVRDRSVSRKEQTLRAGSQAEAESIKNKLEDEQQRSLFIDYARAYQTTLADLLIRYLREEAPRHKSFEVEGYKINALLEDAGFERQDLAKILAAHPNPHPKVASMKIRKPTGARMGQASESGKFIRKGFAEIVPDDFTDYIDERCQAVAPATVDREIDIFSAVCRIAIDTWRIHVAKNPMDGVRRPRYYNERDRRLKGDEEERLLRAAREEDREQSVNARLEQLMAAERLEANGAGTVYRRKQVIKGARQLYMQEAEDTYEHVPLLETFANFQLMTGARRSETLTLTWSNVDLETQTAYLPETKNGRARKLALRSALVDMLRQLPRTGELVFPIGVDGLRKAWARMCQQAGLTGDNELRIHDLRHEAISRVAEAGSNTPGGFSLVDLQHFSGHRDVRMLLRYAHLCTQSLAKRLDAAFASNSESTSHHGRRRLTSGASVTLSEILNEQSGAPMAQANEQLALSSDAIPNVIHVDFARRIA